MAAPIKREWAPSTPEPPQGGLGYRRVPMDGFPTAGIGPEEHPATGQDNKPIAGSSPLDAEVECPGGPLWSADENDRQNGPWATKNFQGRYWTQEPVETSKGVMAGMEPTSPTDGSIETPDLERAGRRGNPLSEAAGELPAVNNQ